MTADRGALMRAMRHNIRQVLEDYQYIYYNSPASGYEVAAEQVTTRVVQAICAHEWKDLQRTAEEDAAIGLPATICQWCGMDFDDYQDEVFRQSAITSSVEMLMEDAAAHARQMADEG